MNKLYFVRHAENVANITKEFSCKHIDYSLTDKGICQAEQTAVFFKSIKIDEIWTSPLKRAIETGSFISKKNGIVPNIMEDLREVNVGDLELEKPTKESWDFYLNVTRAWKNGDMGVRFPGGENCHEMLSRFYNALCEIFANKRSSNIVVVGHGGIFSTCIPHICKNSDKSIFKKENNNCSISEFLIDIVDEKIDCELLDWANCKHLSGIAAELVSGYPDYIKR